MHHHLTAAAFLLMLPLLLLACDALPGGKPNPGRAEGIDDPDRRAEVCSEVRQDIRDWERDEMRKIEDDFTEGKVTTMGAGLKALRLEDEADELRDELDRACRGSSNRFSPPTSRPQGEPFPTSTLPASRRR